MSNEGNITLVKQPTDVIIELIPPQDYFPNNPTLPIIIYKNIICIDESHVDHAIKDLLSSNLWSNAWTNGIYDFHHYHSNTHEVLVIMSGKCTVCLGGPQGKQFQLAAGDVIIHPAGVSHCNLQSSTHFKTIGAYPAGKEYDMCYGKEDELEDSRQAISNVRLPFADPIYGVDGPLFKYWK